MFRIQLGSLWYQNVVCKTLLSKVKFCPYIEMGVAKRASFWPALESFVLPLSTTYLKISRAARFAEERYFIEVRPLTKNSSHPAGNSGTERW